MAKTSAIQKNLKRIKLVKKYAKKRAALKKIINNKKLELAERFEAQLKLNKLPKNSAKIRIRNRCEVSGRPHGVGPQNPGVATSCPPSSAPVNRPAALQAPPHSAE